MAAPVYHGLRYPTYGQRPMSQRSRASAPTGGNATATVEDSGPVDLQPPTWTREERQSLVDFWTARYATAPTMRAVGWYVRDREGAGQPAGGDGLFVPALHPQASVDMDPRDPKHPVRQAYTDRDQKLAWEERSGQVPDAERVALLRRVEGYGIDLWEAAELRDRSQGVSPQEQSLFRRAERTAERQYAQALGDLLTYDAAHGSPVADARRDFEKEPIRGTERAAWLERDGRQKGSEEIQALSEQGAYDPFKHRAAAPAREQAVVKNQPFWLDNATAAMVVGRQEREGKEVAMERAHNEVLEKVAAPGVPMHAGNPEAILAVEDPKARNRVVAEQQMGYLQMPVTQREVGDKNREAVQRAGIQQAAKVDPEFGTALKAAIAQGQGTEYMRDRMKQVDARHEQVTRKLNEGRDLLPLRGSDVVLLRTRQQCYALDHNQVQPDAPKATAQTQEAKDTPSAPAQGQAAAPQREIHPETMRLYNSFRSIMGKPEMAAADMGLQLGMNKEGVERIQPTLATRPLSAKIEARRATLGEAVLQQRQEAPAQPEAQREPVAMKTEGQATAQPQATAAAVQAPEAQARAVEAQAKTAHPEEVDLKARLATAEQRNAELKKDLAQVEGQNRDLTLAIREHGAGDRAKAMDQAHKAQAAEESFLRSPSVQEAREAYYKSNPEARPKSEERPRPEPPQSWLSQAKDKVVDLRDRAVHTYQSAKAAWRGEEAPQHPAAAREQQQAPRRPAGPHAQRSTAQAQKPQQEQGQQQGREGGPSSAQGQRRSSQSQEFGSAAEAKAYAARRPPGPNTPPPVQAKAPDLSRSRAREQEEGLGR